MTTALTLALLSVFGQVALTLWAIFTMGRARLASIKAKETKVSDVALDPMNFAPDVRAWQNSAHNQFETPILLFAGVGLAAALDAVNLGVGICAALYFGTRLAHRWVHVGSNHLETRFMIFAAGLVALLGMWASLAFALLVG